MEIPAFLCVADIDLATDPSSAWTAFSAPLDTSGLWRRLGDGELATESEIMTALSSLLQRVIHRDSGGLDNVELE